MSSRSPNDPVSEPGRDARADPAPVAPSSGERLLESPLTRIEAHNRWANARYAVEAAQRARTDAAVALAEAAVRAKTHHETYTPEVQTLTDLYENAVREQHRAENEHEDAASVYAVVAAATIETDSHLFTETKDKALSRTYTLPVLEAAAQKVPPQDWDAHRQLARIAVASGFSATVTQDYSNDASDPEHLLTHHTSIGDAHDFDDQPDITPEDDQEGPMGSTVTVETFRADLPDGYFGASTPLDDSPHAAADGTPDPPEPSHAHMSALNATPNGRPDDLSGPTSI